MSNSTSASCRAACAGPLCASLCDVGAGASALSLSACRRRKARTVFTDLQLSGLEKRFESQRYLSTPERLELAAQLCLSEAQIKARAPPLLVLRSFLRSSSCSCSCSSKSLCF